MNREAVNNTRERLAPRGQDQGRVGGKSTRYTTEGDRRALHSSDGKSGCSVLLAAQPSSERADVQ